MGACHGALAQLGERGLCKPEVRGSIPLRSTINKSNEHLRVFVLFFITVNFPGHYHINGMLS